MKTCACMHSHFQCHSAWPPKLYVIVLYVRLIMFPLWLAIVILFYFLFGYWLWKLIRIFHYCDYEMATDSSVLAWRIPGMGEPGGLPSLGSHRVGHDWSNLAAAAESMNFYLSITSWTSLVNVKKKSIIPETLVFIHLIRVSLLSVLADLLSY